ncbi:hypothetical protein ACIA8K_26035 [Catenuloplanes sp. NPDC051500]|uniref:hypothetical protein n=1 Tax=Catenuloplanes sp. NPDC051500 TaxID=3363959 RepID=UPI0037A50A47
MPTRPRRLLAALATALCLTACGGGDGGGAEGATTPTAWPQPVDGKVTEAICDVLTTDDFLAVGVHAMRWEDRKPAPHLSPNAVTCHALGGHFLTFNLQPNPESAELYFTWLVGQNTRNGGVGTAETAVPGADESWLTTGGDGVDLLVRRGALIINLAVGFLHDDKDFDPAKSAATLIGQALERLPDVGRTATGGPHQMVMTVTGKNSPDATIIYHGPLDTQVTQETVGLPWTKTFPFPTFGTQGTSVTLTASSNTLPTSAAYPILTCVITVDGVEVGTGTPGTFTSCRGSFTEKG